MGPIPARTGQPTRGPILRPRRGAYPRSHGATKPKSIWLGGYLGLSPLARGNRTQEAWANAWGGPIPARTGQPDYEPLQQERIGAYPRSHGATQVAADLGLTLEGLSPLARGNLPASEMHLCPCGPIPARTGQPKAGAEQGAPWGAYPRSHGATPLKVDAAGLEQGLSPLARGNPKTKARRWCTAGPIPARTGQPAWPGGAAHSWRAYPRSHGATVSSLWGCKPPWGLSPLARGNLCATGLGLA